MKRIIIALLIMLGHIYAIMAQEQDDKLKGIVPIVTPEVGALIQYVKNPVSYDRGQVDISIPLYEISVDGLTIPISINYSHTGIKPQNPGHWLGQGWTLNAVPSVGRSINGLADIAGKYTSPEDQGIVRDRNYVLSLSDGLSGAEQPDEYYYKLLGKSGSFFFKYGSGGIYKPLTFPFEPIKINHTDNNYFEIKDDNGTIYHFGKDASGNQITEDSYKFQYANHRKYGIVSWKCTQIITPNREKSIKFEYYPPEKDIMVNGSHYMIMEDNLRDFDQTIDASRPITYQYRRDQIMMMDNEASHPAIFCNSVVDGYHVPYLLVPLDGLNFGYSNHKYPFFKDTNNSFDPIFFYNFFPCGQNENNPYDHPHKEAYSATYLRKLKSINFDNGVVIFNQQQFIKQNPVDPTERNNYNYLSSIEVRDKKGNLIKEIRFINRFVENTSRVIGHRSHYPLLEKNEILDRNRSVVEKYEFYYNGDPDLSYTTSVDFWGNKLDMDLRQGNVNNVHETFSFPMTLYGATLKRKEFPVNIGYTDRLGKSSQTGLLKTIIFPTGGRTDFEYESHKYMKMDRMGSDPWHKYAPIKRSVKETGGLRIKTIKHFDPVSNKAINREFRYGQIDAQSSKESGLGIIRRQVHIEDYACQTDHLISNRDFFMNNDSVKISDPYLYQNGLTTKTFFSNTLFGDNTYSGASIVYDKVTEYVQTVVNGVTTDNGKTVYEYNYSNDESWVHSYVIQGTNIYMDRKNDWRYGKLRSVSTYKRSRANYELLSKKQYIYTTFEKGTVATADAYQPLLITGNDSESGISLLKRLGSVRYLSHEMETGALRIESEIETQYNNSDSVQIRKDYYYNNQSHLYPTQIDISTSDNSIKRQILKYPLDASGFLTSSEHTSAKDVLIGQWNITPVLEEELWIKKEGNQTFQPLFGTYNKYKVFENGLPALYEQLSHKKGNAAFREKSNLIINNRDVFNNPVEVISNKYNSYCYIWSYNGQYPIAFIKNINYNHVIQALGGKSFIDALAAKSEPTEQDWIKINSLRSNMYFNNSEITTYVYNTFNGIMSITDPSGKVTDYDYDSFGRLENISIENENDIKQPLLFYQYHYQNQ